MTSVLLRELWLTDAADVRSALVLPIQPGSTETWPNTEVVEEWAAGRFRAIGRDALSRIWTPKLMLMPIPTVRELQQRAGRIHWARDPFGGRIACLWSQPVTTWEGWVGARARQEASVVLTLAEVTHTEVGEVP